MAYTALYRKFRPAVFSEIKGQDAIVTTLKNQVAGGKIGHAYLFCGTRGTGKTSAAKVLAKAANCEHPRDGEPCGACASCKAIENGTSLNVIEIDAASNNGVDNIRDIREEVAYAPTEGKYKVYIIDEAHMLSPGASNALLKTLEEPPAYVIFILATTEIRKIPATVLSRCQRYDFKRIAAGTVKDRLRELLQREGIEASEEALGYLARLADGSLRDALSLTEQCLGYFPGQALTYENILEMTGAVDESVYAELLTQIHREDAAGAVSLLNTLLLDGRELAQLVPDFLHYLRNLLLIKDCEAPAAAAAVLELSEEKAKELKTQADALEKEALFRLIRIFSELQQNLRLSGQKRILAEVALVRACRPQMETDTESLQERIRCLERKVDELQAAAAGEGRRAPAQGQEDRPSGKPAARDSQAPVQESPREDPPWETPVQESPRENPPRETPAAQKSQTPAQESPAPVQESQTPATPAPRTEEAVPADVRRLCAHYRDYITEMGSPTREFLAACRLSLSRAGNLLVVAGNETAYRYLKSRQKEVEAFFSEKTGKTIHIEQTYLREKEAFEDTYADLEKKISLPLETVNEE